MIGRDILNVATPSMRPPWHTPQPVTALEDHERWLMYRWLYRFAPSIFQTVPDDCLPPRSWRVLTAHHLGRRRYWEIGSDIGVGIERARQILKASQQTIIYWRITEKGRIAAALAMHKDPEIAAAFAPEEPA